MKQFIYNKLALLLIAVLLTSCNDFLDEEPQSTLPPEAYLKDESHLLAYSINLYSMFPSHSNYSYGTFINDANSDNQVGKSAPNIYVPVLNIVGQAGGYWAFEDITRCNYFLNDVLPKYEKGEITGNAENIKHYIGEVYFMRAYQYFYRMSALGDFPIVTQVLADSKPELIAASKREPRNEVARSILGDLDKAIEMMKPTSIDGKKNRLSRQVAYLFKSRVALYEGTWLKNFKGTAFVPNGEGWPGKSTHPGYQYPSGGIDQEIDFFLDQAIAASDQVASSVELVTNTGTVQQATSEPANPYMNMFSSTNMSSYSEVLLWREYNVGHNVVNSIPIETRWNQQTGLTRAYVNSFLMADGTPSYHSSSGYSEETIQEVRANRDSRLFVFLKEQGQKNIIQNLSQATHGFEVELIPPIIGTQSSPTGYVIRKGNNSDGQQHRNGQSTVGSITFRAVEAYLNYVEAYYERHGSFDDKSNTYWTKVRTRAKLPHYSSTIDKTDMIKEALSDWGAYSGGIIIDKTRYNIRRERRSELLAEGLRYADLCRWRAMDQMVQTPYHVEGMKIWGNMQHWYVDATGQTQLKHGGKDANVSAPSLSNYLRPYQIQSNSSAYNGYKWKMAHYLAPIATNHFQQTAPGGDYEESIIYQNPGWSRRPNTVAEY